jgi:hypothetical protein
MTILVLAVILAALTWWAFTPPRDEFRTAHARDRWLHGLGRIYVASASPARRGNPTGTARGGEAAAAPVGQMSKETGQ